VKRHLAWSSLLVLAATLGCGSLPTGQGPGQASGVRSPSPTVTASCASPAPSHRAGASVAYDSSRKATVLFGGLGNPPSTLNETWLFDGACWQQPQLAVSPPPRFGAAIAYDPVVSKTVLIGGRSQMTGQPDYPEDAWTWDGSAWTQLAGAPRLHFPFASFDPARRVVGVFGFGPAGVPETWTWDGATWLRKSPSQSPSAASQSAMCFDQSTSMVLLYGGFSLNVAGGVSSETWLWDGTAWTRASPAHNPGPRQSHLLVCGPQTILFGGLSNQTAAPGIGTWLWSGTDWQQLTTTQAPEDCCGGVVYDGSRFLMLETGRDGIPIWQWSGSDWNKSP
jgi:hypothetical protein